MREKKRSKKNIKQNKNHIKSLGKKKSRENNGENVKNFLHIFSTDEKEAKKQNNPELIWSTSVKNHETFYKKKAQKWEKLLFYLGRSGLCFSRE